MMQVQIIRWEGQYMNVDDIIKNSFKQEDIRLNEASNNHKETLDYILDYMDNRKIGVWGKMKRRFTNTISTMPVMDAVAVLIFVVMLFVIPGIISHFTHSSNSSLASKSPSEINTQKPSDSPGSGDSTYKNNTQNQNDNVKPGEHIDMLALSPELKDIYDRYSKSKNDELMRGLEAIDVCKMYFYAESKKDYETLYSLYLKEEKAMLPTKDVFLKEASDAVSQENISKLLRILKEDVKDIRVTQTGREKEETAVVNIYFDKETFYGTEISFSMSVSKNGIWKVNYLPLQ